ncbi:DUF3108 domain-containing protein [Marinobacter hydrocarbonoclasticus]|nr:DUF3108 domain-containing protein [Marinobacter nauticus]
MPRPLSLLIVLLPAFSLWAKPVPFEARYQAYTTGLPCGKGTLTLTESEPGQYQYHAKGKICVIGQHIDHQSAFAQTTQGPQPGAYETEFDGWFRDRLLAGTPQANGRYTVTLNGKTLPDSEDFPRAQWEPALMLRQLAQARDDVQLSYTWGDETRDYLFQYQGEETLKTPLGPLKTHKFVQDHPNESRVATFWFAPELDGLLVQLEATRLGVHWLTVKLKRYHKQG